jgi:glycosyltransferase involved in cell wall biosynthesis
MRLSVVIPCYNERHTIRQVVERVQAAVCDDLEIIIVDDASTDGSGAVVDRLVCEQVKVLHHRVNRGKGTALDTALQHVTGDIVLVQDADLEYNPRDYPELLAPILNGDADVVFGSRFMGGQARRVVYFWHMVGNRLLTLLSNVFTNINLTDMETGYKVFTREALTDLRVEERRFGFEPEITAKLAQRRARFYEVGISYAGRSYEEGKKITWRDGVRALFVILKYNIFRRESYVCKAARLVMDESIPSQLREAAAPAWAARPSVASDAS